MNSIKKFLSVMMALSLIVGASLHLAAPVRADETEDNSITSAAYTLNLTVIPSAEEATPAETYSYDSGYDYTGTYTQTYTETTTQETTTQNDVPAETPAETPTETPAETPAETTTQETASSESSSSAETTSSSSSSAPSSGPSSEADASATDVGPHTHYYWIVETTATCTSAGYYTAECEICGDRYTKYVDYLGDGSHSFANYGGDMYAYNFCTSCGYTEYAPGIDQWTAAYNTMYFTNSYRTSVGLNELTMSSYLNGLAQQRAIEIASDFSHGGFRGCNGENIAKGYYSTWEVCAAWAASAGHYENMVRDWFTEYGFGYYVDGSGQIFCVQLFN